ncbi:hypothetical protein EYF80_049568 [Liparis tanakae]|uniref:Uncharacterized protein n=1 Tax=Liparis tanakae TaxID=230148 RepID=A0A4Z2FHK5_9TELE|nr:hypothetical protein EYF80_049568 [Liparis tanakae]
MPLWSEGSLLRGRLKYKRDTGKSNASLGSFTAERFAARPVAPVETKRNDSPSQAKSGPLSAHTEGTPPDL